jgi:hypothetical protein
MKFNIRHKEVAYIIQLYDSVMKRIYCIISPLIFKLYKDEIHTQDDNQIKTLQGKQHQHMEKQFQKVFLELYWR